MNGSKTLLAALAVAGAVSAAPADGHAQSRGTRREVDTTFFFSKIGTVILGNGAADIVVTGWDQTTVRVKAWSDEGSIHLDGSSSRLVVETTRQSDAATIQVTVPRGVRVVARSNSGTITVKDTWGDVDVQASSGNVLVSGARDVEGTNLSGDLEVRQTSGAVTLSTNNGDCAVTDARGSVEASTVTGDVTVRRTWSKIVRLETTNGTIQFDSDILPDGRYEFVSHDGEILLALPRTASALVGITTWSGSVQSEFPLTRRPGFSPDSAGTKRYTFTLGQALARITAETFSGDVSITSSGGK